MIKWKSTRNPHVDPRDQGGHKCCHKLGVGLTGGLGVLCQTRDHGPWPMLIRGDPSAPPSVIPQEPLSCASAGGTWYMRPSL